jgi:hypothetical protein
MEDVFTQKEQITECLIRLSQGDGADVQAVHLLVELAGNDELTALLDPETRRAVMERVNAVCDEARGRLLVQELFCRIGEDGSCANERDRDTFLMLAGNERVIESLPVNVRLQIEQRAHMVRQRQAHAA